MPMSPALVAMSRIVKARMPTQIPAQKASVAETRLNPRTIPATGSALYWVARSVMYMPWSRCTGKTLRPIVGRNAATNSTATITAYVARGTDLPGFLASSERLEMVSMPVYVTMAIEMLARKLPQFGATPQWMLLRTTPMLSRKKIPRITSANWVTRSVRASARLRALDSWMPTMLMTMRSAIITTVAPTWSVSFVLSSLNSGTYLPKTPR